MNLTDAEKAYHQIKRQIITTKLPPGVVISEAQLMKELKLGRTPIREAIKQLQTEDFITVTPRRGMFVTDISITDLSQLFEVRIELEALSARLATERITPSQLERLEELAQKYQENHPTEKDTLIDLDSDFHSLIAEAAHNKFLHKFVGYYYDLSIRIWYLAINYAKPEDIDVSAHLEVLDAIRSQDAESAEQRMRMHVHDFHQIIKQYI